MAEYIDRKKIHFHAFFDAGDYSQAMRCINNMTPVDVIEREKVNKAIKEMEINIKCNTDPNTGKVNILGQGQIMMLNILKRNIGE